MADIKTFGERVIENLEKVVVGKGPSLELIVIGLLCQGHVLIEDVPGVGKTVMARSLARSLDCTFNRIQFTPDMLPSDVTGVSIFNQQKREFEFRPGPVIGQIVLADEINRATPKTQASLLEAMEERTVTVDGVTHELPRPFMVLATQNPIEYEGTFPLPEAQLDRFLLRVRMGYPTLPDEIRILDSNEGNTNYWAGCQAGLTVVGIDSIGNVKGCESLYDDIFIEGNLRRESLTDIWFREGNFSYNRNFEVGLLRGKCGECDMGPYCRAGCRGACFFTREHFFENAYCVYGGV